MTLPCGMTWGVTWQVLPAVELRCRRLKIRFTWQCNQEEDPPRVGLSSNYMCNRLQALEECVMCTPDGAVHQLSVHLVGERRGWVPGLHPSDETGTRVRLKASLEDRWSWVSRMPYQVYSVALLEMAQAYLRGPQGSDSFFFLRQSDWMDDYIFMDQVPGIIRDQFVEQDPEAAEVMASIRAEIHAKAGPHGRVVEYRPEYRAYVTANSTAQAASPRGRPQQTATGADGRGQTRADGRGRPEQTAADPFVPVNKAFWKRMVEEASRVRGDLRTADGQRTGKVSKADVRAVLGQRGLLDLIEDQELVKLMAAYDPAGDGMIDYAAMLRQFTAKGTVTLSRMVDFGRRLYACVWETIQAAFPAQAAAGRRFNHEVYQQERLLELHSARYCEVL